MLIYANLSNGFQGPRALAATIVDYMLKVLANPEPRVIIHGDYSPRNMLRDTGVDGKMILIDWEMCSFGAAWQDIGQCAAELFLGGCDVRDFLKGYLDGNSEARNVQNGGKHYDDEGAGAAVAQKIVVDQDMVRHTVIHGSSLAMLWTPMAGWLPHESQEEGDKRRRETTQWMLMAWNRDWKGLKETIWGALVRDEWC